MNITFTQAPIPELIIAGHQLATLGFTRGTLFQLELKQQMLWITLVTDDADWNELCEASQYRPDLGADWVRDNGQLVVGGEWLTNIGITDAIQVNIIAAPGTLRLQRQETGVFNA